MSSHKTPLTSRCGYMRGRKRIKLHPISELRKQTPYESPPPARDEDDSLYSSDANMSSGSMTQLPSDDSGYEQLDDSQERKPTTHYSLRRKS